MARWRNWPVSTRRAEADIRVPKMCPGGGMVDTQDLKSCEPSKAHASSSLAPGTIGIPLNKRFVGSPDSMSGSRFLSS